VAYQQAEPLQKTPIVKMTMNAPGLRPVIATADAVLNPSTVAIMKIASRAEFAAWPVRVFPGVIDVRTAPERERVK